MVGNLTRALNGDLYFDDRVENWIKKVWLLLFFFFHFIIMWPLLTSSKWEILRWNYQNFWKQPIWTACIRTDLNVRGAERISEIFQSLLRHYRVSKLKMSWHLDGCPFAFASLSSCQSLWEEHKDEITEHWTHIMMAAHDTADDLRFSSRAQHTSDPNRKWKKTAAFIHKCKWCQAEISYLNSWRESVSVMTFPSAL